MVENESIKVQVGVEYGEVTVANYASYVPSQRDLIDVSSKDFIKISNVIEFACQNLAKRIEKMENKPTGYSVEFGINAGGEVGIPFITKGSLGANFKVIMNWENK